MSETMIWPIYLDKDKSLSQGRKISTEYAISEPRIREIEKAAKRLGYTFIVETDKSYPGEWYENSGRNPRRKFLSSYPLKSKPFVKLKRAVDLAKKAKREKINNSFPFFKKK